MMTKIIKVKVRHESKPGGVTHYVYPPEYDANLIEVTCYEFASMGINSGDRSDEYCIGVVSDKNAPEFLKSDDIIEMSDADARIDGRKWRPQNERITDPDRVIMICKKAAAGTALTNDDKDAIDPDKSVAGIEKTISYDAILDRSKEKWQLGI